MKIQPITNWQETARVCLHILDQPTPQGRKEAREIIMNMAKAFDASITQQRENFEKRNKQEVNQ